jgi:predicted Zn finger-like uncharacterized protein
VFRVTSTILRAAHGQVRCGRCNTQFDAIERLLDGEDPQTVDTTANSADQGIEYEATALSHEEIVLEGNRIEISGVYRRIDDDETETEAGTAHTQTVIEEFNIDTEEWENPFNRDAASDDEVETEVEDIEQALNAASLADALASLDTAGLTERHASDSTDQVAIATINHLASNRDNVAAADGSNEPVVSSAPAWSSFKTAPLPVDTPIRALPPLAFDPGDEPFADAAPQQRWPWAVASVALILLLAGQTLHHFRETLARHPDVGPHLSSLYAAIGQPLEPQWQLHAYSIKQWGIVSDPQESGTLRVRASVTNGASFAQPYPLLQLSLEDRFGSKVGTREFKPEEYLARNTQATRLLAAGESANVDLAIVDPGADAVGFQFDTCLLLKNSLQCSHDAALKQP